MRRTGRWLLPILLLIGCLALYRVCDMKYGIRPRAIIVHISASRWGDAEAITQWHIERGWDGIGYHAVIMNGHRTSSSIYDPLLDGKIEPGRSDFERGAHCRAGDMNARALGVCLIGDPDDERYPTPRQIDALIHYCATKCREHRIPVSAITQHSDHEPLKPLCASLDMDDIRRRVQAELQGGS